MNIANKLTITRVLAVPFFIAATIYYVPEREYLRFSALAIFIFAIFTDVLDGYIARKHQQKTTAGAILDPLADKLLVISAFFCLYQAQHLAGSFRVPISILLIVVSRDVILLTGSAIIYLLNRKIDIVPTTWGKATTFFQVIAIIGVLLQVPIFPIIWYGVAFVTVVSGLGYIKNGVKVINAHAR